MGGMGVTCSAVRLLTCPSVARPRGLRGVSAPCCRSRAPSPDSDPSGPSCTPLYTRTRTMQTKPGSHAAKHPPHTQKSPSVSTARPRPPPHPRTPLETPQKLNFQRRHSPLTGIALYFSIVWAGKWRERGPPAPSRRRPATHRRTAPTPNWSSPFTVSQLRITKRGQAHGRLHSRAPGARAAPARDAQSTWVCLCGCQRWDELVLGGAHRIRLAGGPAKGADRRIERPVQLCSSDTAFYPSQQCFALRESQRKVASAGSRGFLPVFWWYGVLKCGGRILRG